MGTKDIKKEFYEIINSGQTYKEMMADALAFIFKILRSLPSQSREVIDVLIPMAEEQEDFPSLASLRYYRGWTQLDSGQVKLAQEEFFLCLEFFEKVGDKAGISRVYSSLGFCSKSLGNLPESFQYYDKALEAASEINDDEGMARVYANMADTFQDLQRYEEALLYFKRALALNPPYFANKAIALSGVGNSYHLLGENEKSLPYLLESLAITEEHNIKMVRMQTLTFLGSAYMGLGQKENAYATFAEVIEGAVELGIPRLESQGYLVLGELKMSEGKFEEALENFRRSLELSESMNMATMLADALKNISLILKKQGKFEEAYEYFQRFHDVSLELFGYETAKEVDRIKKNEALRQAEFFKKMYGQISSISLIGREVTSSLDLKKIVYIVYEKLNEIMDASIFGLGFYDDKKEEIEFRFFVDSNDWAEPFTIKIEHSDSMGAWCVRNKKEIIINNLDTEYNRYVQNVASTSNDGENVKSLLYVPLRAGNKVIGILSIQSLKYNAYEDYQIELFKALSAYITIAVENAKLYEEVQVLATKDPLTNLLNRMHFMTLARKEFASFKRNGQKFTVIMFDLDYFKKVNDHFGHQAGDRVLQEVAAYCSKRLRAVDLLCRYGGEEFFILLPNTGLEESVEIAEELRKGLSKLKIKIDDGRICKITASFGVSIIQASDETIEQLLKRADVAMYESKNKGRNAVTYLI